MSANSLDEMLCEWEKRANAVLESAKDQRPERELPIGESFARMATPIAYYCWIQPERALTLISLVRAALAPHLPVELPERPTKETVKQFATMLTSISFLQWAEFVRYADAMEAEVKRLREELKDANEQIEDRIDQGKHDVATSKADTLAECVEITPTENGTVSLEWITEGSDVYLEIGETRVNGFIRKGEQTTVMSGGKEVISAILALTPEHEDGKQKSAPKDG